MKLNILLAKTDHLRASFKAMVNDYSKFFSKSQTAFRGEKRTYTPREGQIDEPSKRKNSLIQTTVDEKFNWFVDTSQDYIDALFSQERTNAIGLAKAELVIDGKSWGEFTSLELLRLKSLIESGEFKTMLTNIPTRSDSEIWKRSDNEMYSDKDVFESPLTEGVEKTTIKESYILPDPNLDKSGGKYTPQIATKSTPVELGDYTFQKFSGELSQTQRAQILRRRETMLVAVIEALKACNDVEAVKSNLNAEKIFSFIFFNHND